jgi:hypothetical protein
MSLFGANDLGEKSLAGRGFWLYPRTTPPCRNLRLIVCGTSEGGIRHPLERRYLMSHSGKKDKGKKEQKKKSKHTLKEKRKLKQEKHQQGEKKHIVIPG